MDGGYDSEAQFHAIKVKFIQGFCMTENSGANVHCDSNLILTFL